MPGIKTGVDRRGAMPYGWEGRDESLPLDPTYAVLDYMLNANWRQTFEAIGKVFITGIMCTEGTVTYGASDSTHCRLTLPTGFTEVDDYLVIGDGSRIWRVQVAVENEIEFTATQRINGAAGSSNYDGIQSSLWMLTLSKDKLGVFITQHEISLGNFTDALDGDCIRVIHSNAQTIKTKLDLFDLEHESDGKHSDGIIENSMLDKENVLVTQGFVNKVTNSAFNINGVASKDYWDVVNGATLTAVANSCGVFPNFYLKTETAALNAGAKETLERFEFEPDVPVRLVVYAKGAAGTEKIKVVLNTAGTSNETSEIELTDGWVPYYLTFTPDSACSFDVSFLSTVAGAQEFYIASVNIALGDVATLGERSPRDAMLDAVHEMTFYCHDPLTTGQFAAFVLEKNIKILRVDAYVRVDPATDDVVVRISDGSTDYDITIAIAANSGNNAADQEYDKGETITVEILANSAIDATCLTLVVQYRNR